ncbi:unnamed protein product [Acanthoscelides obtectus]|uniref:Uncharacterized protein n=1 Tax=Acanthoscelides obtectus TaxID=200917 RepID=A0A9P0PVL0_ACAOB|nr:unnamed protein product [Acanthoscelides obtectus]CAK1656541.1 hypothetical protein AOBTE_LOCUS19789 [Acanthoscelides obtectus]
MCACCMHTCSLARVEFPLSPVSPYNLAAFVVIGV